MQLLLNEGIIYDFDCNNYRYRFLNFEERVNKVDSTVQIATIQYSRRAENVYPINQNMIARLLIIQLTSLRNLLKSEIILIFAMISFISLMK